MAHDEGGRPSRRARAPRLACHLWLLLIALGAPVGREQLELLPVGWPRERRELIDRLVPHLADAAALREQMRRLGVDDIVADTLLRTSPGPLLAERCAHALLLATSALTPAQAAVLREAVRAADAAQRALDLRRRGATADLQLPEDDLRVRAAREALGRQIREIEIRLWRVAGYALDRAQRIELRKRLPLTHQQVPDLLGHIHLLPDLTPEQATRVVAIATEFGSETAADQAAMQVLQAATPRDEGAIRDLGDRLADRLRATLERGRRILTEEQALALDALPPMLSPQDRKHHPGEIVAKLDLAAEQRARLQGVGGRIAGQVELAKRRAQQGTAALAGEVGPEAPQNRMMELAGAAVEAASVAAFEEGAREAVLEILTPGQVAAWVVSPE